MDSKSSTTIAFIIFMSLFLSPSLAQTNNFGTCPRNPLQIGVCASVLGLANVIVGDPRAQLCCSAFNGVANIQIADCLCFVFRPIPLVFALDETVRRILFACNRAFPIGFQCPPPPPVANP